MKKIFIMLLVLLSTAGATVRYVSKTGSSTAPYISWTTAADSLQKCLDICQYGDTIYIGEGKFEGLFTGGDGLTLIGAGIDKSIISRNKGNIDSAIYLLKLGRNCKVMDITFKSEAMNDLYGLRIQDSSFIAYNKFINLCESIIVEGNTYIKNNFFLADKVCFVGIDCWSGEGSIEISNNYFDFIGVGIESNYGTPLIHNNIFYLHDHCIGIYTEKVAEVDNNLFIALSPSAQTFFGYNPHYDLQLNNVVIGTISSMPGALLKNPYNVLKNNIAINGNVGFGPHNNPTTITNFSYNNSYNNSVNYGFTADSTNLSVDPMFINDNVDSLDVHLQAFSPMIDMGDPTIKDVDGTRSDIGLYGGPYGEEYLYPDLAPKTPKNVKIDVLVSQVVLHWKKNTEADFAYYRIYKDTVSGFTIDSSKKFLDTTSTELWIDKLPYTGRNTFFKVTAIDKQGHVSRPSEEVGLLLNDVNGPKIKEESYMLYPAYPNPFNPSTRISYNMKERGHVKLQVYTLQGELISTLVDREQEAGYYETDFTGKNLNNHQIASGVYLYRVEIKNNNSQPVYIEMKKMIYLK